jgi:hypothetical protein
MTGRSDGNPPTRWIAVFFVLLVIVTLLALAAWNSAGGAEIVK